MPTSVPAAAVEPALALGLQRGPRVPDWPVAPARLRRWVRLALAADAQLTLRFSARAEAIALNRTFRGRDYAPNVLTFTYPPAPGDAGAACAADIVICIPVVREQARAQRKPFDHHLAHLVIHGVLHAQGHDHQTPGEAARMEALETALLRRLRIPDPYLARPATGARRAPD
jgi:probable rRNA maturation factor